MMVLSRLTALLDYSTLYQVNTSNTYGIASGLLVLQFVDIGTA